MFVKEKGQWCLDIDYTNSENFDEDTSQNQIILFYIIKDALKIIPNLEFGMGYFLVFENDGSYAGIVFNQDIFDYMEKNSNSDYAISKNILESRVIVEYREELEKTKESK
jgi:hypothetical protein